MKNFILSCLTIVLMVVAFFTLPTIQRHLSAQESPSQTITLRQRLEEIGSKFDRYFTLEGLLDKDRGGGTGSIENKTLIRKPLKTSISEEMQQLRQTFPTLDFEIRDGSKVIHIIDKRIAAKADNPLDQVVKDIKFNGITFHFVDEIAKHGVKISPGNAISTKEIYTVDYSIRVNVQASNKNVRELLTDYVPLEGRGRILWISTTYSGKDNTAHIRYLK
jgi:hypothetical protein